MNINYGLQTIENLPFPQHLEDSFRFNFLFVHIAHVDAGIWHRCWGLVHFIEIRAANCQNAAVGAERQGSDGRVVVVELAEAFFIESIPDTDVAVTSTRGKGVVSAVKADCVYRIDQLDVVFFDAVTFEGELLFLHLGIVIKVLHSDTTLNGRHNIAFLIWEDPYAAGLILQRRFTAHDVVSHVPQVPNDNFSVGGSHHHLFVDDAHRVHLAVVLFVSSNALGISCVPKFHRLENTNITVMQAFLQSAHLIPTTSGHTVHLSRELYALDAVVV